MDYWKISSYLPRETRAFVPLFIAAAYIMTYHCDHHICPVRANFSIATDTIMIDRALHFDQIAEVLQIDKEMIRFYNPQYKREIIPGNIKPSALRLPIESTFAFINHDDSIYTHRIEELLANCTPVDLHNPNSRKERITHTVKSGETVYTIANLYGVTAQNLRRWNGLSGARVGQGRRLVVNIDNGGITHTAQRAVAATAQSAATQSAQIKPNEAVAYTVDASGHVSYVVKEGDTLSVIARKYPGVTVGSIQQANGMTTTKLRIGQILKIPQG
jgi:membrane-bound lytic murein transglycosylase D